MSAQLLDLAPSKRKPRPAPATYGARKLAQLRFGRQSLDLSDLPRPKEAISSRSFGYRGDDECTPCPLRVVSSAFPPPPPASIEAWAGAFSVSCFESLHGLRSFTQLETWMTPELFVAFGHRVNLNMRKTARDLRKPPLRFLSLHVYWVSDSICEVSTVVKEGNRCRALAVRAESHRSRWRATALEIG